MTISLEQIDETGTLHIHSQEGVEVLWEFYLDDGVTPDPTPPTVVYFQSETGLSKLLTPGTASHILVMTLTEGECDTMRAAATPVGQTRPRTSKWAVVDQSASPDQVLWSGLVEFSGW